MQASPGVVFLQHPFGAAIVFEEGQGVPIDVGPGGRELFVVGDVEATTVGTPDHRADNSEGIAAAAAVAVPSMGAGIALDEQVVVPQELGASVHVGL